MAELRRRGLDEARADLMWREVTAYIDGRHALLASRMAAGLVRDGHGDLLADDIFCLADGPRALDCLDFDNRLRWIDVLDDVACLAMDLEDLGAAGAPYGFLGDTPSSRAGHSPRPCYTTTYPLHHYTAYRAVMRAKVTAVRRDQEGPARSLPAGHVD